MKRVLIVEDEVDLCKLIASQLRNDNVEVIEAHKAEEGLEHISQTSFDLVVSDIRLPGMDGIDMIKKIKQEVQPLPRIFVMSGYSDYTLEDILAAGGEKFFSKPADIAKLFEEVAKILE